MLLVLSQGMLRCVQQQAMLDVQYQLGRMLELQLHNVATTTHAKQLLLAAMHGKKCLLIVDNVTNTAVVCLHNDEE